MYYVNTSSMVALLNAIEITDDITRREIYAGKDPIALAATVLYLSCMKTGEHRAKKDIARAADTTDVTLRNRFEGLQDKPQVN
jgi:transcription initiation factor TFIIB